MLLIIAVINFGALAFVPKPLLGLVVREGTLRCAEFGSLAPEAVSRCMLKLIRIVLTITHLDHVPEHCEPANLRAWCQRHHLAYDQEHHAQTRYATRRAHARTADMFEA